MYKVEVQDHMGNWIHKSFHKNKEYAVITASVQVEMGRPVRILHEGKILLEEGTQC